MFVPVHVPAGDLQDCKAVIPDSSYADVYQVVVEDCRTNGAYDPSTMGSVPNVGLMAQKAEEYGSHDKTFEIASDGVVRVVDADGRVLMEQTVEAGDIWRACQAKDPAIRDWVKLAVARARATGVPTIFWLNEARAHLEQALAIDREASNRRGEGLVLAGLGLIESEQGRRSEARSLHEQALAIHREVGNRRAEADVLGALGVLDAEQGRQEEARAQYEAALTIAREVRDPGAEGRILGYLGTHHADQGRPAEARSHFGM